MVGNIIGSFCPMPNHGRWQLHVIGVTSHECAPCRMVNSDKLTRMNFAQSDTLVMTQQYVNGDPHDLKKQVFTVTSCFISGMKFILSEIDHLFKISDSYLNMLNDLRSSNNNLHVCQYLN